MCPRRGHIKVQRGGATTLTRSVKGSIKASDVDDHREKVAVVKINVSKVHFSIHIVLI